jgi:PKD domain/Secretion system C-terminal sorting domain
MGTTNNRFVLYVFSIFIGIMFFLPKLDNQQIKKENRVDRIRSTSSPKAGIEAKKGRWEYFHRMLRDPATGEIPRGIREKELAFAEMLQEKYNSLQKNANIMDLGWKEAGPVDVGGRTRALAIDVTDPNTIIAGGVSGGMWKSTDKGATWQMKSTTSQVLSVTSVAQDIRSGHTDTWYYASGEARGSAHHRGHIQFFSGFSGAGIYKSTDNGETWNLLLNTADTDLTEWRSLYDFVSKIIVHPITGSVFAASNAFGIIKSNDGGNSFNLVLGKEDDHYFSDIIVTGNGTLVASLSSGWSESPLNQPGIYKSINEGQSWTNITPNTFPSSHHRSVICAANNNTAYIITTTGDIKNDREDIRFHKTNINTGVSEDRSANMPIFPDPWGGEVWFDTQGSYNMTLAVKPDDENFVVIGATNLFRSTNGFSSKPNNAKLDWIGGYGYTQISFDYPNLHADIHSFAFDPTNPNSMWWGHDGGLSYTSDIRNTNFETFFPWENKNNGYNVTQFYMMAIPNEAGDDRIMGGTQDNGSPSFRFDGNSISQSFDVSSGDGAYAYFGDSYPYASTQNGLVLRATYDGSGNPIREYPNYSNITPKGATGMLFVNPFVVDPNDENIMILTAGSVLWRNNQLNSLPDNPTYQEGMSQGWSELSGLSVPSGFVLTTLAISRSNPAHRLYYGASDKNEYPGPPKIYKLDNAHTAFSGGVEISIPNATSGSYLHNIAVNPDNGNELFVVLSNYNIVGLYHSTNGGQSFTAVEGNLEGDQNNPGPSMRAATILPTSSGTLYLVATSTGVYSTSQLNGAQTTWTLEGPNEIGNVVVEYITSRKSDGRIVAGTHGRGAFVGQADAAGVAVATTNVTTLTLQSRPGESGNTSFELSNDGEANLNFNISVIGNFGSALPKFSNNNKLTDKIDFAEKTSKGFGRRGTSKIPFPLKSRNGSMQNPRRINLPSSVNGNDVLWLDDGSEGPDDFDGWDNGWSMYWANEFNLSGVSFDLETIQFYMQTELSYTNEIHYTVSDANLNLLADEYLSLDLSPSGSWYIIPLKSVVSFNAGETFYIGIESNSLIYYPAGIDYNAQVIGKSYYFNWDTWTWDNINTFSGYENAAYLIRAIGTIGGGGGNQDPVAIASISKTQVEVNENITFDGSQSYDNDGNITQYLWNFGDGGTSTQQTATHSYAQANTYNYSLTVTDNQGATGQKTGQVIVSAASNNYVTVDPSSGTIQPGGSQTISLTLDAQNITEGTYTGQVTISGNGGNIIIPIDYLVDVEKLSDVPTEYNLSQNYPNPFNPATSIEFAIPRSSNVSLKIYDMLGKEVSSLLNEKKQPGTYKITFDASNLASGVYVYRLETNEFLDTKKLVLLK